MPSHGAGLIGGVPDERYSSGSLRSAVMDHIIGMPGNIWFHQARAMLII
ncbi:hypothetical protein [Nocardia beijingensis]